MRTTLVNLVKGSFQVANGDYVCLSTLHVDIAAYLCQMRLPALLPWMHSRTKSPMRRGLIHLRPWGATGLPVRLLLYLCPSCESESVKIGDEGEGLKNSVGLKRFQRAD